MEFVETELKGVYVIKLTPFKDERGWFSRVFCKDELKKINVDFTPVQVNHSFNVLKGTFRGLHYQVKPASENKIVRCIQGKILDFIVDVREDSPTYLKWISVELSKENMNMVFIPAGFAHGFQTLENNSEILYFHSEFYSPDYERGLRYDDPKLDLQLPLKISTISERDISFQNL